MVLTANSPPKASISGTEMRVGHESAGNEGSEMRGKERQYIRSIALLGNARFIPLSFHPIPDCNS